MRFLLVAVVVDTAAGASTGRAGPGSAQPTAQRPGLDPPGTSCSAARCAATAASPDPDPVRPGCGSARGAASLRAALPARSPAFSTCRSVERVVPVPAAWARRNRARGPQLVPLVSGSLVGGQPGRV